LHWNTKEPGRARQDITPICKTVLTTTTTATTITTQTLAASTTSSFLKPMSIQSGDIIFLKTLGGTWKHIDVEGSAVQARWESQGNWQAITIEAATGGSINAGDTVFLKTLSGAYIDVTGNKVQARWNEKGSRQELRIEKKTGDGPIFPDDLVCLKSWHTQTYLDVESHVIQARWDDCGEWQTMLIQREVANTVSSGDLIHLMAHTGMMVEVRGRMCKRDGMSGHCGRRL
jgi:hypothetical protein